MTARVCDYVLEGTASMCALVAIGFGSAAISGDASNLYVIAAASAASSLVLRIIYRFKARVGFLPIDGFEDSFRVVSVACLGYAASQPESVIAGGIGVGCIVASLVVRAIGFVIQHCKSRREEVDAEQATMLNCAENERVNSADTKAAAAEKKAADAEKKAAAAEKKAAAAENKAAAAENKAAAAEKKAAAAENKAAAAENKAAAAENKAAAAEKDKTRIKDILDGRQEVINILDNALFLQKLFLDLLSKIKFFKEQELCYGCTEALLEARKKLIILAEDLTDPEEKKFVFEILGSDVLFWEGVFGQKVNCIERAIFRLRFWLLDAEPFLELMKRGHYSVQEAQKLQIDLNSAKDLAKYLEEATETLSCFLQYSSCDEKGYGKTTNYLTRLVSDCKNFSSSIDKNIVKEVCKALDNLKEQVLELVVKNSVIQKVNEIKDVSAVICKYILEYEKQLKDLKVN